ncbi:MAG: hypothetical protein IJV90_02460, partial [Candidatus Methanomethylophilaceae archaeon]|nr:hypothetical protein [Candidatus Methanomethylophilaceae archaeon]
VLNAAMYTTVSPAYYVYTTLEAALAAGATDITVTGEVEIASDITIPVGTKIDATGATDVTIVDDATVTVEAEDKKSGTLKNGDKPIYVEGTLVIENLAKSGVNKNGIHSDTSKAVGEGMIYTNLYNALADAVEGDEVEITAATVTLDKDLTVPTGVTLDLNGKALVAGNNITVTVDGTIDATDGTYTVSPAAGANDKAAVTTINGLFLYTTGTYDFIGAYFGYDGVNAIAPLTVVAGMVDDVESDIVLNGDMVVGDIAFDYTGDDTPELIAKNKLTAGTIDLGALGFTASAGSAVTATIALTNGSVVLDNVTGIVIADVITYDIDNNEVYTVAISGNVEAVDDAETADVETGSVGIVGEVSSSIITASGVTINVPADATLTITAGTIDAIVVEGTVDVDGTVSITTATVMGIIDGDATATITTLYAGVVKDDITATTAANAVIGDKVVIASTGVAYVAPGTTINDDIADLSSTEYYVEDELYLTAYAGASTTATINGIVAKIDNAEFNGWLNEDKNAISNTAKVGEVDKVYASINYEIFTITVNTIPGTVVYVDGIKFESATKYAAGVHTIAVYLEAGYEGTPVINVNGTTVTDSFTISGEETVITVSGVTAATGSGTIVIEPAEDEGMALTDILLIVLVVLIVIMAIIVALRMMRS